MTITTAAKHSADAGQHVTFIDDAALTPELSEEERTQTLVVKSSVGAGDDQFVRLTTVEGEEFGWFRITQLRPAEASDNAANLRLR